MRGPGLAALPTQGFLEEYPMTTQIRNRSRSSLFAILSFPFVALWKLLSLIVQLVGRLLAVSIGLVLLIAGALVSLTSSACHCSSSVCYLYCEEFSNREALAGLVDH